MIQIRPSQLSDLDRLMEIFDHARKFMASVKWKSVDQWLALSLSDSKAKAVKATIGTSFE